MYMFKILLDRSMNEGDSPCHSLLPIDLNAKGITVQVMTCSILKRGTGYSLIRIIDSDGTQVKEGKYTGEYGNCVINKFASKHFMATVVNKRCKLASLVNEAGCFLTSAIPVTDTLIEWTLIGSNIKTMHKLLDRMKKSGFTVTMKSSKNLDMVLPLTEKQEEYFDMAMRLGYYNIPKRTNLDELCEVLGCSKSTLNVILRTAEKKIFDMYMVSGFFTERSNNKR